MKFPKEVSIKVTASLDTPDNSGFKPSKDEKKEIEGRRKVFSGEDFKL